MFNLFFNIKIRSKKCFLVRKYRATTSHKKQAGQIGIVVILIMMVMLTVGLSIASRSAREVEISSEGEKAARAFNTTESGIEQALSQIYEYEKSGEEEELDGNLNEELLKYNISERTTFETKVYQGYSAKLPLDDTNEALTINWSKIDCPSEPGDPDPAAMLVSIFSNFVSIFTPHGGLIISQHYAIDACDTRSGTNNFIYTDIAGVDGYKFQYTIENLTTDGKTPLFARITPIYNDAEINVAGLPATAQYGIFARGRSGGDNLETKAIIVDRTIPSAPAFMNFGIVSGGSISK